jgi:hypothetical protein
MLLLILLSKILGTIVLAGFCGWAWRFGGSSNGIRWVREAVTGFALVSCITLWWGWSYWYILIFGASWIESTYFKSKGSSAMWWNWMLCGILYALIPLPAVIVHHLWVGFAWRTVVLIPVITLWRTFVGDVQWSESGVGVWQIITLPLILIP